MSTFSDVKGSASVSSISRLAPAFQSLPFSCIIPPTTNLKYNLLHFPAEVLHATSHRRFPGVLLSQSLLRLRPIRPIHQAPGPLNAFFSFCLFCLICQPSLGTGGGIGWRGKFELREGEEDNLGGEVFFIFVGQFANAPAPGSQVRIQSWLLASLLWEGGDRKVRAEPLSSAGTISSAHDFGCR